MKALKRFLVSDTGGMTMKASIYLWPIIWSLVIIQAVTGDNLSIVSAVHADVPPQTAPAVPPSGAVAEIQKIVTGIEKAESQAAEGKSQLQAILEELAKLLDKPVVPPAPAPPLPLPTPAPVPAPTNDVKIAGPTSVKVDQSAIFKVPIEFAGADYDWAVEPPVDNSVDGSNRKETFFVLQNVTKPVYFISFVSWDKRVSRLHRLTVVGGTDDVPPDDKPPVDDATKKDPFGLAKIVVEMTKTLPPEKKAMAKNVAKVYRDMQAAIAAGKDWGSPADPLNDFKLQLMGKHLRENLVVDGPEWEAVRTAVNKAVGDLYASNKLPTVGTFGDALGGIALGWELVR